VVKLLEDEGHRNSRAAKGKQRDLVIRGNGLIEGSYGVENHETNLVGWLTFAGDDHGGPKTLPKETKTGREKIIYYTRDFPN